LKKYLKYFGIVYIIFFIILIAAGSSYISHLPVFTQEKLQIDTLIFPKDTAFSQAELPLIKGTVSPPVDVFKLSNSTPGLVEKGKGLYSTNCASCHGEQGRGDGVAGAMMNPKPRNFTSLEGWTNGPKFTQIYITLQEGIVKRGMASYANLPPEDRIALIHYIHETFTKNYPKNTDDELKELDKTYSLIQGAKLPNQIPVALAKEKILADKSAFDRRIDSIVSSVKNNKTDSGAVIFRSISNNLTRSITVLVLDSSWYNNEKSLVDIFISNPVQNGYKVRSYSLSQKELSLLQSYLRNLFSSIR